MGWQELTAYLELKQGNTCSDFQDGLKEFISRFSNSMCNLP